MPRRLLAAGPSDGNDGDSGHAKRSDQNGDESTASSMHEIGILTVRVVTVA
jgi:hypothetical protein